MEKIAPKKLRVLFICFGNSCRSAMAEKLARRLYGDRFVVDSAGVHPALPNITMGANTFAVMDEAGVDMTGHQPKHLDAVKEPFDIVVNMSGLPSSGLRWRYPHLADAKWHDWDVPDPRGLDLRTYRHVRYILHGKIRDILG